MGASFDEQFFSAVVDAAPDAILIVDPAGNIVFTNQQATVLLGYTADELTSMPVDDLLPDDLRATHHRHRAHYQSHPQVRPMGLDMKLRARRKDGVDLPVEISLSPVSTHGDAYVVAAMRDITARVEAEQEIRRSQAALREAEQVLAVADDRERIARDLHDTVIQRLFAAGLSLQATATRADPEVRDRIQLTVDDLDQTIRDVRTAVFSLQAAPKASERGLRGLLLEVTAEARATLGFEPRVQFDGPIETMDEAIAEHLIPVLREALSNVAKHAHAKEVRVAIEAGDDVVLRVTDDGVGMPASVFGGNGLTNLRRRAEALGGTFTVDPGQHGGCTLVWCVPSEPVLPTEPAEPAEPGS